MKNNTLKTKILSLLIAFAIAVILSSIISTILHLIFTRVPEEIINMRPNTIIQSLSSSKEHFEMFILTIVAFMLVAFLTIFKIFDLKDYKSKTYSDEKMNFMEKAFLVEENNSLKHELENLKNSNVEEVKDDEELFKKFFDFCRQN